MSFPRYTKYKPSGVEWLGEVPQHWETPPLYLRYEAVLGKMLDEKRLTRTHLLPYVRNVDVQWDRVNVEELPELDIAADEHDRFTLKLGDLLICEGGEVGRTAIWRGELDQCAFQKAIHRLRPLNDSEDPRFFFHCMSFAASTGVFVAEGNPNTIPHLTGEKLRRYRFPTPPLDEQAKIASFLDRETSKIDGLVGEQRRLIELLKEKRQAVISHAVTKGLNPHAPLKPSGIEWLGDVPEHWRVGKLGYACKLRGGFAFSAADFGADGVVVVRMNNLKRGQLDLTEAVRIPESCCNEVVALAAGDLVWGMSGSTGETGSLGNYARVRAEDLPCQLNQRVGRFVVDKSLLTLDFFENVIQTAYFYEQVMLLVTGTAQFNVSSEQVQSCLIALPTIDEQRAIADCLARETAALDALTAEAERGIELLQERRTALISAAVTGQIDVRGLAESEDR